MIFDSIKDGINKTIDTTVGVVQGIVSSAKGENEEIYKARLEVCKVCPDWKPQGIRSDGGFFASCGVCGCKSDWKLRLITHSNQPVCPLNKFKDVDKRFLEVKNLQNVGPDIMETIKEYNEKGPTLFALIHGLEIVKKEI
jgi:hypothetical protein